MSLNSEIKKGSLFFKQVVASIKGDDAEVIAARNGRKAISAFNQELASLEAQEVSAEEDLQNAEERLMTAICPKEPIENNRAYIQRISEARAHLEECKEVLEDIRFTQKSISEMLEKYFDIK